jgi:hypothetical protein
MRRLWKRSIRKACGAHAGRRRLRSVRLDAPSIDVGVQDVVELFNRIRGVTTRASCEGAGQAPAPHRHGDLAYVRFRHPLPLQLHDFLLAHLDAVARIEDDGIYSRWPVRNREFLDALARAVRAYRRRDAADHRTVLRCPLPRLRARCARAIARGQAMRLSLCLDCADVVLAPHADTHRCLHLLSVPGDQHERWFAEFVVQAGNALDATLVEQDGWSQVLARAMRSDFGAAFLRRWLRYRARMVADLTTRQLYRGAQDARRQYADLDFFFDDAHAVFTWA